MRGLLLGATVATAVGAIDDFRGLRWWEKLAGQVGAAAIPVAFGDLGRPLHVPVRRRPRAVAVGRQAADGGLDRRDHEHGQLPRRARRARRRRLLRSRAATFAVIALSLGKPDAAIVSAIVFGACLGFLRHNFYPARIFMGDSGAMLLGFVLATVAVEGLLKTAATVALFFPLLVLAVPIIDTGVRRRPAAEVPAADHGARPGAPPPPLPAHRLLAAADDGRSIWLWCATLAGAALATRFIPFREGGEWHLWPTVAVGAIALVAVLVLAVRSSTLLEIVKLANPRVRRQERSPGSRRSA